MIAQLGEPPPCKREMRVRVPLVPPILPGWRNRETRLTVNQVPQGLQVRALLQEPKFRKAAKMSAWDGARATEVTAGRRVSRQAKGSHRELDDLACLARGHAHDGARVRLRHACIRRVGRGRGVPRIAGDVRGRRLTATRAATSHTSPGVWDGRRSRCCCSPCHECRPRIRPSSVRRPDDGHRSSRRELRSARVSSGTRASRRWPTAATPAPRPVPSLRR